MVKWVKCSDRLPELPDKKNANQSFLVHWSGGTVAVMEYSRDFVRGKELLRWHWHGSLSPWVITHWMPLPDVPEVKEAAE